MVPGEKNEKKNFAMLFDPKPTPIQLSKKKFKVLIKTGHPKYRLFVVLFI